MPGALCQASLRHSAKCAHKLSMEDLAKTGSNFFRASATLMATSMLDSAGLPADAGGAFLTLDAVAYMAEANNTLDERLLNIADCGESEAGQQVLRDLILSFKLPRWVVGVRRTSLLTRASNKITTTQYPDTLNGAHDAALRGSKWSFEKDLDPVHKMAALLAGICIVMCVDAHSIRKDDMYYGRVSLPFLETAPPKPGVERLTLIEHTNEWVVYSVDANGRPAVQLRQQGYDGLCQAIILFSSKIVTD